MKRSELLLRIFDQVPDLLVVINRDLRIEMCNWRGGYDHVPEHRRRKGTPCYEVFYPGRDRPCPNCQVLQVFSSGRPLVCEKIDPRIGHIEVRSFPLFNRLGGVRLVVEQVRNINQRKEMQVRLSQQYVYLRTLADVVPVPMYSKDAAGRYLGCNQCFEDYLGFLRAQVLGKGVRDLLPGDAADIQEARDRELLERGGTQSFESELQRPDGSIRQVVFHKATFDKPDGSQGGLVGAILDITERKEAMARLRQSEERYRQFFEDDLTGAFIATVDGQLQTCNPAFARIFGFSSAEQSLGLDMRNIHPDPATRERMLERLRQEKKIERVSLEVRAPDGRTLYLILNAVGIFDDGGELVALRGYLFDDTERQNLADQLMHSQKMEAVGRLAAGLAHDFNNLLTAIIGYSDALQKELVEPRQIRCAEQIHLAGERAAGLTDKLLALSRRQRLQLSALDLNQLISGLEHLLQRLLGREIRLVLSFDCAPVMIRADEARLEQVVLNLVLNARDAMPDGGTLTISTARVLLDEEQARSFLEARPGAYGVLTVTDDGQGIPEQVLPHIFEPFFTTKQKGKGTGMGLATTYGVVTQGGGFMSVSSCVGTGTTFKVFLPEVIREAE